MKIRSVYILTIMFCFNHMLGQEMKEIDMVITIDEKVIGKAHGILFEITAKDESNLSIAPVYHPGSLTFSKTDYDLLMSSRERLVRLKFYYLSNELTKDYSINFHKDWLKEDYVVLNVFNLNKRKFRKVKKPIERNASYSASLDFGHYSILDLNNQSEYKIPNYH